MKGDFDILIASANTALAIAIELVLTREGHRVTTVSSGAQALSHIKALQPKLAVLDTDLSEMSGLEVCQRLRMDPDMAMLPIVMITSDTRPVFKRKITALGASLILSPPLAAQDIIDLTKQIKTGATDAH